MYMVPKFKGQKIFTHLPWPPPAAAGSTVTSEENFHFQKDGVHMLFPYLYPLLSTVTISGSSTKQTDHSGGQKADEARTSGPRNDSLEVSVCLMYPRL